MRYSILLILGLATVTLLGRAAPAGPGPETDDDQQRARDNAPEVPAPQIGQPAPLLKLRALDGSREVDLAGLIGKQPVLLMFGSYT
jgi:hypothetical protein